MTEEIVKVNRKFKQVYIELNVATPLPANLEDIALLLAFKALDPGKIDAFRIEEKKRGIVSFRQYIFKLGDTEVKVGCPDNKHVYIHVSMIEGEPMKLANSLEQAFVLMLPVAIELYIKHFES